MVFVREVLLDYYEVRILQIWNKTLFHVLFHFEQLFQREHLQNGVGDVLLVVPLFMVTTFVSVVPDSVWYLEWHLTIFSFDSFLWAFRNQVT